MASEAREWRRLWMQEEEAERRHDLAERQLLQQKELADRNYNLARDQMAHQMDLQTDAQAFQQRMAEDLRLHELGLLDREEKLKVSEMAINLMPTMSLEGQWQQVEHLEQMGSPLAATARGVVRQGIFQDPNQAIAMVDTLFTAPPGTPFTPEFVEQAARAVIRVTGMEGETADDFMKDVKTALERRAEEREEWNEMEWASARTSLRQSQANLADTRATTRETDQRTANMLQQYDINEEQRGEILESLRLSNVALASENAMAQIREGFLPQMMAAQLGNILATTQGIENQNRFFEETFENMVEDVVNATAISREEARHIVATGAVRDAAAKGDLELLKATIAHTHSHTDLLDAQSGALSQQMQEARIAMATQLVEDGHADLIGALADDLFSDLGLSTEQQAELVEGLKDTANSRMSHREKMEAANVRIALATADYEAWKADSAESQRMFQNVTTLRELGQTDRALGFQEYALGQTDRQIEQEAERIGIRREEVENTERYNTRVLDLQERGMDHQEAKDQAYLEIAREELTLHQQGLAANIRQEDERIAQGAESLGIRREELENTQAYQARVLDLEERGFTHKQAHDLAYLGLATQELALQDRRLTGELAQRAEDLGIRRMDVEARIRNDDRLTDLRERGFTHEQSMDMLHYMHAREELALSRWIAEDRSEQGWEGVAQGWEGLAIEARRVGLYGASLNPPPVGTAPLPSSEVHSEIFSSLRISTGDLVRARSEVSEHTSSISQLRQAIEFDEETGEMLAIREGARPIISAIAQRYSVDMMDPGIGMDQMDVVHHLMALMEGEENAARLNAESNVLGYVREWMSITGQLPTAQQLGFQAGDPIFTNAVQRISGVSMQGEINSEVHGLANHIASNLAANSGRGGSWAVAEVGWEQFVEQTTPQQREHAGLGTIVEFAALVNDRSEEFHTNVETATAGAQLMGQMWGRQYNVENEIDRYELDQHLGAAHNSIFGTDAESGFIDRLANLPASHSVGDLWTGRTANTVGIQEERRLASTIVHTFGDLLPEGLIEDGRIQDRGQLTQFLVAAGDAMAEQRRALQVIDGEFRVSRPN